MRTLLSLALLTPLAVAQTGCAAEPNEPIAAIAAAPDNEALLTTEAEIQNALMPHMQALQAKLQTATSPDDVAAELAAIASLRKRTTGQFHDFLGIIQYQVLDAVDAVEQALPVLRGIIDDPQSDQGLMAAFQAMGDSIIEQDQDNAEQQINELVAKATALGVDQALITYIDALKVQLALKVGQPFPELSFTSTTGEEIDVNAMAASGKVVLVDFWATWCGPCITKLPHMQEIYAAHHDQGFEVVAINLDEDRQALDTFIQQHKLPWPQYFDGLGWSNKISTRFGIGSIPATFLIGPDGTIVARDLLGDALEKAISEHLTAH